MILKVETHDCSSFVACFWHTEGQDWEGLITSELSNMEVSIIKSDQAIILLRKSDFVQPAGVSNGSNHVPR